MNRLVEAQVGYNAASRDGWDTYRSHRKAVTELLVSVAPSRPGRICILGAGNGNDLDLAHLVAVYREVHLVDLDAEALALGVGRQGCADPRSVRCHGAVDVTGMLNVLAGWSADTAVTDGDLVACRDRPVREAGLALPSPFDVVASTCLLSQLIGSVLRAVGERHPRFLELLQAVRLGHLLLFTELLASGGSGVLVTDVVSSDTFPPLGSVPENQLHGVLVQLIRQQNFFHGVNPAALLSALRTDPLLAPRVETVQPLRPWLWDMGARVYAVWAVTLRRRNGSPI
jgi:hypothetical protein